jgi:hypothetical protein
VRGNNDLVSVGRSPNVAAKLSDIRNSPYRTYITAEVYNKLNKEALYSIDGKKLRWEKRSFSVGGEDMTVYRSKWWLKP